MSAIKKPSRFHALKQKFTPSAERYGKATEAKFNMIDIVKSVIGFTVAVTMIWGGAGIIVDEKTIGDLDSSQTSTANYTVGIILCLIGSIMVAFGLFKFIKNLL